MNNTNSNLQKLKCASLVIAGMLLVVSNIYSQDTEWKTIFDGTSLDNWEHVGDGEMKLVDGGLLKTVGGMGLLYYTPQAFEDVQIKVVFNNIRESNAGVFIRVPEAPTEPWMPVNKGYEVQIDNNEDDFHATGALYSLTEVKGRFSKGDQWNTMIITLDGDRTMVEVNGNLVTDYTEGDPVPEKVKDYEPDRGPRPTAGYIGLQNHGGDDVVLFKEVSVRPLK
ncbi:MAG: DUF1080 domain-containing protein [Cyclobacteriaceae bacterium]